MTFNGLKVPVSGPYAYCEDFSSILMLNRCVHEPLEELVFLQILKRLHEAPVMLEPGDGTRSDRT